jgi:hypothetical protein
MCNQKTKIDTLVNKQGLSFPVQVIWSNTSNDWFLDEYNAAKCFLYQNASTLFSPTVEKQKIIELLTQNVLNKKGGTHA